MDKNIKQLLESLDAIEDISEDSDRLETSLNEFYTGWLMYKKALVAAAGGFDDAGSFKNREVAALIKEMRLIFERLGEIQDRLK